MPRATENHPPSEPPEELFARVVSILDQARGNVVRAVNTNMVHAYWLIGREIVEGVQGGEERAEYGKRVVKDLSARLTERYGKGFSIQVFWSFRQFHLVYSNRAQILFPPGRELPEVEIRSPLGRESSVSPILSTLGIELALTAKSSPPGSQSALAFSPQLTWSHDGLYDTVVAWE